MTHAPYESSCVVPKFRSLVLKNIEKWIHDNNITEYYMKTLYSSCRNQYKRGVVHTYGLVVVATVCTLEYGTKLHTMRACTMNLLFKMMILSVVLPVRKNGDDFIFIMVVAIFVIICLCKI